jgi:hypothetical protein
MTVMLWPVKVIEMPASIPELIILNLYTRDPSKDIPGIALVTSHGNGRDGAMLEQL